ncbi:LamG-like jellyroll fold domain-containing protein [Polaribacter sp. Hel1_85]|uniref:LamG-like jellyroll fold domain-containing protein n=1 Tax=Polaribacter sp. Hel1_85 TaxID=1250005 RepID=UPI00052BA207|nr:LamG-like jellyroll fold domain-containing protein [Polaribacter sp. Hel1_85]KGL63374.1 concanavalin A-like lectin/glucanase [Polaribacter sp. Hel1_85]
MIKKITFVFFLLVSITVNAQQGTHLNFDGTNDQVTIAYNSEFDFTTGTIETWVRPQSSANNQCFAAVRNGLGAATRWSLHINNTNNTIGIYNGAGFYTISTTINSDEWYHLAFVITSTTTEVFKNGVSVGTIAAGFNTTSNPSIPLIIGSTSDSEFFLGDIDGVRVWKDARTASEISSNKDNELVGTETDLVAYYKFNQGTHNADNTSVTTLTDATSNNYSGTLSGFTLTGLTSNWVYAETNPFIGGTIPPIFENSTPSAVSITETSFTLNTDIDEAGKIYYVVLTNNATAPTPAEVKAGTGNLGSSAVASGSAEVSSAAFTNAFSVTGLTAGVAYDVYVVAEDEVNPPNIQTTVTKIEVTTTGIEGYIKHGIITFLANRIFSGDLTTEESCNNSGSETINGITASTNDDGYWWHTVEKCLSLTSTTTVTTTTFSRGVNVASIEISIPDTWTITASTGVAITHTGSGVIFLGFNNVTSFTVTAASGISPSERISNIRIADDIWTGATDTNWATTTNWTSEAIPTTTSDLLIPNIARKPIISASTGAVANEITIDASSSVTIESGGSLILEGTATVNGDFIYNVNAPDDKWHLVSSPVTGEQYDDTWNTANSIATNLPNEALARYINTSDADGDWVYFQDSGTATTFGSGTGYSLKRTGTGNYSFMGTFPAPPINPTITANDIGGANQNRWTLVGNPFPAYINIATFLAANTTPLTDTHEAIYIWNASANGGVGEYQSLTTGQIHPGQGFFVNANVASTSVTFTKAMQSHQVSSTFYRTVNPKIIVTLNDGSRTKSTEINYLSDKTTGLDPRFDIGIFTGQSSSFNLYSQLVSNNEGVNFMKQSLPDANYENMIIPIGVNAATGLEIAFSTEALNLPNDIKVFLEDRETNTFTRLDETNSTYKVTLTTALNGIGRFYLHTTTGKALNIDTNFPLQNISIYKTDATTLRIAGLQGKHASIKVYTILREVVLNSTFQANGVKDISLPKLTTGVYLVELQTEKGTLNKKIILE